jgi:hypothetical protein
MLMPILRCKTTLPFGGGYELNRPDIGMVGQGTTFEMLMTGILKYRKANAIPCGLGLEEEVEREICAKYPAECAEGSALIPKREGKITFSDIIHGTKVMLRHKLAGSPLVDETEAIRRAAICAACPNNVPFESSCSSLCGELKDLVISLIGSKSTPSDGALKSCAVCKCYAAAAAWVPLEFQLPDLTETQRAQFQQAAKDHNCWKVSA